MGHRLPVRLSHLRSNNGSLAAKAGILKPGDDQGGPKRGLFAFARLNPWKPYFGASNRYNKASVRRKIWRAF